MLRRWRVSRAVRLIRLRSTLRSRPLLAALVRTLHVPDPNIPLYSASGDPNPEYDAYLCTIASVVMQCPNLEALTGFVAFYNHTFDRLTHALSTRTQLRQHVWIIAENEDVSVRSQTQLPPGLLDEHQTYQFELYHQRWKRLETLMLSSPGGLGVIEHELFIRVLHSLPALRNLCVSSFDPDDFHDNTLLSLPPWVTTLRLEECLGITDAGLTQWAANPNAAQIERLSLIHQNVTSLLTLSKIFASLGRLWKFTILQTDVVLSWPKELGVLFQPVLGSGSLRFLHWDIQSLSPEAPGDRDGIVAEDRFQMPNVRLALSISHTGFPSLRRLRAPRDTCPPGALQSVCQMVASGNTTFSDDSSIYHQQGSTRSNSLHAARLRAQKIACQISTQGMNHILPCARQCPGMSTSSPRSSHLAQISNIQVPAVSRACNPNRNNFSASENSVHELISPVSPETNPFSPLAPDDGIISPITADREERCWYNRDSDKEVMAPLPQRPHMSSEGIANPESRRRPRSEQGMCVCGGWGSQKVEELRGGLGPPPRNPLRLAAGGPSLASSVQVDLLGGSSSGLQPIDRRWSLVPDSTTGSEQYSRPAFYLQPDIPGRDDNGGLIGWGELLNVHEKVKVRTNDSSSVAMEVGTLSPNMCTGTGSWDQCPGSEEQQPGELSAIVKVLSAPPLPPPLPSTKKDRPRSKSTSKASSRLSLALGLGSSKEKIPNESASRHVPRPKGDRGGCVSVSDFF
ncbi:hypothetical protein AYO20_04435 [Fonsecaea nubica]|uniref:Uncharacterized protein n=1 Tax=Fonsecaea nubica TaxID=856822 RepID=A0A178D3K8_9EURO|nr:hypothetical protein AYO20_04435 [Fonsecaea nubica]OAL36277.1 hypothetical protein AYO20_04435 [Fonsecaea nubica]